MAGHLLRARKMRSAQPLQARLEQHVMGYTLEIISIPIEVETTP